MSERKILVAWQQQPHQGPEERFLAVFDIRMTPGVAIHMREDFARQVMERYPEVVKCGPEGVEPKVFAVPEPAPDLPPAYEVSEPVASLPESDPANPGPHETPADPDGGERIAIPAELGVVTELVAEGDGPPAPPVTSAEETPAPEPPIKKLRKRK